MKPLLSAIQAFARFVKYPHYRDFEIRSWLPFWRWRARVQRANFLVARETWSSAERSSQWKERSSVLWLIGKAVAFHIILAVGLVTLALVIERRPSVGAWLSTWQIDGAPEKDILGTLAQVAAALLGLYFTALSVVVSTGYAKVPATVRALLIEEQVGSVYFQVLAQFAATTVLMLGLLEFKVTLGPLAGLLGIGLGIFSIFGFVVLGVRTLYFFEPSILVPTIHRRMENAIQRALAGRFRWRDSSFQNHWQKHADAAFETYGDLVDVVVKDGNASSAALVELANELTRLGRIYARHKARIPSDSFWFKRAARQKKFLQTSSFAVDIALATDTGLPPDSVPDRDWFERRTAQLLRRLVKVLVERNDFAGLTTVVERMRATVDTFAGCLQFTDAFVLWREVSDEIWTLAARVEIKAGTIPTAVQILTVLDLNAIAPIDAILALGRGLGGWNKETLAEKIAGFDGSDFPGAYGPSHSPRSLVIAMEDLQRRLAFEQDVYGTVSSPGWLKVEFAAEGLIKFLRESVTLVLAEFDALITRSEGELAVRPAVAVHLGLRNLEGANKIARQFQDWRKLGSALLELNRSREYKWPDLPWDEWGETLAGLRTRVVRLAAQAGPHLAALPDDDSIPDWNGRVYALLGDECISALLAGDRELFSHLFGAFFKMAFAMPAKLVPIERAATAREVAQISAPWLDLMAISGDAEIFSALDGKEYARTVHEAWDTHWQNRPPTAVEMTLKLLLSLTEPNVWNTGQSDRRFRWKRAVENELRRRELLTDRFGDTGSNLQMEQHAHPLIRALACTMGTLTEGEDVFAVMYLLARPELAGIKPNWKVQPLARAYADELAGKKEGDDHAQQN